MALITLEPAHRGRAGFTLMEVMLALVISAMAVTGAGMVFRSLKEQSVRADSMIEQVSYHSKSYRLLKHLIANRQIGSARFPSLRGDSSSVSLQSWCETPFGWPAPCRVVLAFEGEAGNLALVLRRTEQVASESPAELATKELILSRVRFGRFVYLVDVAEGGTWRPQWSDISPPVGVGILVDTDTMLLVATRE